VNFQKRTLIALFLSAVCLAAFAVSPDEKIEYKNAPMGSVTFEGTIHNEKGLKCNSCHPKLFEKKTGAAEPTFSDHHDESSCFACHEISYKDEGNCMTCHSM
jgi:c(7)-type cytochrome triheme protein